MADFVKTKKPGSVKGFSKNTFIGSRRTGMSIVKVDVPDELLKKLYHDKNWNEFLRQTVISKKNIINSGGTSTGKTTFTNALLSLIPATERLIKSETIKKLKG